MKNVFYAFAILAISLMSCESNSDDETNPTDNNILLTKIDAIYSNGKTETIKFTYSEMRLIKIEYLDDSYRYKDFIYEGNKITNINYYYDTDSPTTGIFDSYTYDAQGRVATISTNSVGVGVSEFNQTYNSDNSVITTSSTDRNHIDITTINNGNIVHQENAFHTSTFTHDDKNGVFKNVELRDILVTLNSEIGQNNESYTLNNTLSVTTIVNSTMESQDYTYTYTSFDYPRTMILKNEDGSTTKNTFTYNND
jgi:hypothetical protein